MSKACPICGMHWLVAVVRFLIGILFGLVVGLIIGLIVEKAQAHSWYELECCSGIDCRPVADSDIKHTATGYTYDGLTFDKTMERPSRDGKYHVCIATWAGEDGSLGRSPRCIYVPMFW